MTDPGLQVTTLGGGCFWCLEAVFDDLIGVESVESGYMGGHVDRPTYAQVCGARTGHAEVIQVTFDPAKVAFRDILDVFFTIHDPTTLNRQGADVGTQYRSGIYWHTEAQRDLGAEVIAEANEAHAGRVVTELEAETNYYPAEAYHQHYYARHPEQGYCAFVVAGKVDKFLASFKRLVK